MSLKMENKLMGRFSPSNKILSLCPDGYLHLHEENVWEAVMDCIKESSLEMRLPVAILSVMGSQSSSRSLLTNLVIEDFPKSIGKDDESHKEVDMLDLDRSSKESNGIYLWPRPLLSYQQGDKPLLIWLLCLNYPCLDTEGDDGLIALENFLILASSRIAEIDVENNDFRALRLHSNILRSPLHQDVCDNIVYISVAKWNTQNRIFANDKEAKLELSKMLKKSDRNKEAYYSVVNQLNHVTIIRLKEIDSEPHKRGQIDGINLEALLKFTVEYITDESKLAPRKNTVEARKPLLTLGNFVETLKFWTETVNNHIGARLDPSSMTISAERVNEKGPQRTPVTANIPNKVCECGADEEFELKRQHNNMLNAAKKAKSMMLDSIREWILNNLSPTTVTELMGIYNHVSGQITSDAHHVVEETLWNELDRIIDAECRDRYTAILEVVAERLQSFSLIMMKRFEVFEYFTTPQLESIGTEQQKNVSKTIEADKLEISELVTFGCETLMKYFQRENEKIIKSEEILADELIPEVVNFYNEEMERFLLTGVHRPIKLKEVHESLLNRLVESFKTAFKFSKRGSVCEAVENKSKVLRTTLDKGFAKHLKRNLESLKKKLVEINEIQRLFKLAYIENLDFALKQYSDGGPIEDLIMKRKLSEVMIKIKEQFELEIKQKIRPDEPTQDHWKSVQTYIDTIWKCKVQENQIKIQKAMEEYDKKIRLERMLNFRVRGKSSISGKEPPPLVFQLQRKVIRMGVCLKGKPHQLKNNLGKNSTPFVVGLSTTKDFLYGSEVLSHIPPEGTQSSESHLKRWWWVSAELSPSETDPCQEYVFPRDGSAVKISAELLLAFILKKLRDHVEGELKGEFSTAVIAIPFWFGSGQRVQVKNGGYLAGFTEVFLVNETSACAWRVRGVPNVPTKILVLSENAGTIDATLFAYFPDSEEMKMIGHYGKYIVKKKKVCYPKMSNKKPRNYGTMTVEQSMIQILEKVRSKALQRAKDYRGIDKPCVPDKVVAIAESDKWTPVLKKFGEEYEWKFCPMLEEAVILGAALLSRNPLQIQDRLKENLAFDIIAGMKGVSRNASVFNIQDPLHSKYDWLATASFPEARKDREGLHFFQDVLGKKNSLGSLKGICRLPSDSRVSLGLDVSSEAIFTIVNLSYSPSNLPWYPLKLLDYWSPTNGIWQPMSEEGATHQRSLESMMLQSNGGDELLPRMTTSLENGLVMDDAVQPMETSDAEDNIPDEDPEDHAKQKQIKEEIQANVEYETMT